MADKKTIKLYDGVRIKTDGQTYDVQYIADIWEMFDWDIENNPLEKEASLEITRSLIGFGFIDLTPSMPSGHTMTIEVIPCKEEL